MNYIIDFDKLTIQNAESNGVKEISCTTRYVREGKMYRYARYINDDGRWWAQEITKDEFWKLDDVIYAELSPTAEDYGLGSGLTL